MDRRIAKFAATSVVTGVLSLGFAVATHAADTSINHVDNNVVTTTITVHKTEIAGTQTSDITPSSGGPDLTSGSDGDTTPGDSTNDQTNSATTHSQIVVSTSGSVGSDSNTTISKSSTGALAGSSTQTPSGIAAGDQPGSAATSADGSSSSNPVSLMTPTPVTPELSAQLHSGIFQSAGHANDVSQVESSSGNPVPAAVGPSSSSGMPEVPVPAKNLPIQGALAGISSTLSNITMPLRQLTIVLTGGVVLSLAVALVLVACMLAAAGVVANRRFVDELKASGYSHAARADASDSIFSFATPLKVSFAWAHEPSQKLTFFGVRNKALTFQIS